MNVKKYMPSIVEHTIYDVDFQKVYDSGKRYILIDIDNTLLPYDEYDANDKIKELVFNLQKKGFKIILISNNHTKRVKRFAESVNLDYIANALKPLKFGFKKAYKRFGRPDKKEIISVGDQIVTDVFGSNRFKIDVILVHPIKKKSEKWYTKINRHFERKAIKKISKVNPILYQEIKEKHEY